MTEGAVTILGYGSLVSRASAERTFGPLPDFRVVTVPGYARVFNKVCLHSIKSGAADRDGREIGCACAVPMPNAELTAALIQVPMARAAGFFEREREFQIMEATYVELRSHGTGTALLSTLWNDAEFRGCFKSENEYEREVGQYYSGSMWRDDILPARAYLKCCLDGAQTLGIRERFLDETLLADGTALREYLNRHPEVLDVSDGNVPERYRDVDGP